jgi:hypothetical protein
MQVEALADHSEASCASVAETESIGFNAVPVKTDTDVGEPVKKRRSHAKSSIERRYDPRPGCAPP